jgi:hypothetical protein
MTDIWNDLRFLLGRWDASAGLTAEEKLDLLAQMVANLIDEVELLKQSAWQQSGLSYEEWQARYRKERMWLLFSSQGAPPACLRKYRSYMQTRQETAQELIPDAAQREEEIRDLGMLT